MSHCRTSKQINSAGKSARQAEAARPAYWALWELLMLSFIALLFALLLVFGPSGGLLFFY
jgi:hypothetical protein